MTIKKIANYRYRLIDHCLSHSQKRWTEAALLSHISDKLKQKFNVKNGIKSRQLAYDIALMRKAPPEGFGAPIVREKGYIYYSDTDFSIEQTTFIAKDIQQIERALYTLKQFPAFVNTNALQELRLRFNNLLAQQNSSTRSSMIEFEPNSFVHDPIFLEDIFEFIIQRKAIKLQYSPHPNAETATIIIHPYLLKAYHKCWFLIGYNNDTQTLWHCNTNDIGRIELAAVPFISNRFMDATDYFKNNLGVTIPNKKVEHIILKLTSQSANSILAKPLHWSQKPVDADLGSDGIYISLEVVPNEELIQAILSHGTGIEVMHPLSLRKKVKSTLKMILRHY